jgi:hypothetical protein
MGRLFGVRTLLAGLAAIAALLVIVVPSSAGVAAKAKVKVGLAYTTNPTSGKDTVFSASAGGANPRELGTGYVSSLSPNGGYVAALSDSATGMIIYRSGGGAAIHVPSEAKRSDLQTSWSSNSKYMAVSWNGISGSKEVAGLAVISVPSGKVQMSDRFTGMINGISFAPGSPERVAFVQSRSLSPTATASLKVLTPAKKGKSVGISTLIRNKRITNPLWTRYGIVYDSITPRSKVEYAAYQLQVLRKGKSTQITHMKIPALDSGLVPIAASSSGTRLIADFDGEDNINAYSVNVTAHKVTKISIAGTDGQLTGDGISANGKQLLVNYGDFEEPISSKSVVASVPFGGGKPKVLVHGAASPAWPQA